MFVKYPNKSERFKRENFWQGFQRDLHCLRRLADLLPWLHNRFVAPSQIQMQIQLQIQIQIQIQTQVLDLIVCSFSSPAGICNFYSSSLNLLWRRFFTDCSMFISFCPAFGSPSILLHFTLYSGRK